MHGATNHWQLCRLCDCYMYTFASKYSMYLNKYILQKSFRQDVQQERPLCVLKRGWVLNSALCSASLKSHIDLKGIHEDLPM